MCTMPMAINSDSFKAVMKFCIGWPLQRHSCQGLPIRPAAFHYDSVEGVGNDAVVQSSHQIEDTTFVIFVIWTGMGRAKMFRFQ